MTNLKKFICVAGTFLLPFILFSQENENKYPPHGFVYVHEAIPNIKYEIRYAGSHNFVGEPVDGYLNPVALLSAEAAEALNKVQQDLSKKGYLLKIFDAYRPQRAVNHFMRWARDTTDTSMKSEFYPEVDKSRLFELDYIASRSGHTRGSTVDLTLVETATGKELDMGSPYDFFGKISHHGASGITAQQEENRRILKNAMEHHGFKALSTEWWHYSLQNEPHPDTYFNFPVK